MEKASVSEEKYDDMRTTTRISDAFAKDPSKANGKGHEKHTVHKIQLHELAILGCPGISRQRGHRPCGGSASVGEISGRTKDSLLDACEDVVLMVLKIPRPLFPSPRQYNVHSLIRFLRQG